jgi:hypothetical protein
MAAQDISANLTHPAQRNLAGALDALMIEKFDGRVHVAEQKAAITDGVFDIKPLVGTDTMSNAAMGDPTLQAVVAGVEPLGKTMEVGDQIVQVKTPIIARVNVAMLADVQDRLSVRSRTPIQFGKRIAKYVDEILLHQCVKSGMKATGAGEVSDIPGGTNEEMAAATDETDATKLEAKIMVLAQTLAEKEIDLMDGKLYVAPEQYFTLLKNDKLTDANFSKGNGNYAQAAIAVTSGMPIVMTNRLSQAADNGSVAGSNANLMGANYVVTDEESDVVALFAMGESIMVAQSIPLTSDVYWDKRLLTWFIDSYMAIGAAPDRPDKTAVLRKYRA